MQPIHNQLRYDMVLFDVGGTLLGFWQREPFRQFLAAAGLPASQDDASQLLSRFEAAIRAQRDGALGLGAREAALDAWWRAVFSAVWPDSKDLADGMYRWFLADRLQRVHPDVFPALEALQVLGMPMAVVSNFSARLEALLSRLGLRRFFDFVVVSSIAGVAKPSREIFDRAVDMAGLQPDRLLYVGDHIGDDIEGARGAGLDAVLIDRGDQQAGAACSRIRSLSELPGYVRFPKEPAPNIIFDMDGVVLDSMPMHLATWQRTLAPLGIELAADVLYETEGTPTEKTAQRLTGHYLGQACTDAEAQQLAAQKRAFFRALPPPPPIPGIVPLLHNLKGRGFRLGLVTGSARSVVEESLEPTGLAGLFEVIVTGDQVTCGKPDPEPYLTAAASLGVDASQCLAIENAPQGVESAKAAGMRCVAIETTVSGQVLAAADHVCPDASALGSWLLDR